MAEVKMQGFDPLAVQQLQQTQSTQGSKSGGGPFDDLMQQAAGVLEAARMAKGGGDAGTGVPAKPQGKADMDVTQIGAAQKQSPVRDQAAKPKQNNNSKISQDDKTNARVTDDNAKQGKDLRNAADDAGRKIVSEVAEKLDVDEADVEAAMETLGLSAMQLLDPANLTALLAELSGESDPMALVTDADLYRTLQEVMAAARDIGAEAGISPEDVRALAEEEPDFAGVLEEAEEEPVQVSMSQTDAEGNVLSVQVTMDEGRVVSEQVNSGAAEHHGNERGGRDSGQQDVENQALTEHVVNELAGRMADNTVNFSETIAAEQVTGTDTQQMVEIVRQITEQIRVNFGADVTSMELTLHPASLGNVQLTVAQDAQGRMVAQFAVESETVRQAIESQVSQLQQRLDEQGTRIEAVEVTLASHGFESNLNGEQTGGQADEQREAQMRAAGPRGQRRINLAELDAEEELAEEERIAAEMMAANGGTVDYTA